MTLSFFYYLIYGKEVKLASDVPDDTFIDYTKEEKEIRLLPVIGIKGYKEVYQRISTIPTEYLHAFVVSDNMQEASKKLNILLKKYDIFIDTDYMTNIINLLNYCFSEKLFPNYKENSLKSTTLNHTYGFEKAVVELEKFLREHSKVIISEEPGSGKTHFIKYFLALCCQNSDNSSEWKGTFNDVLYVEHNGDIANTLHTINTLKNYESEDDFPSACNFSNSLLVIDCMYYRENFEGDLEYLSSLPFKIIVITHSESSNIAGFCRFPFFPKLTDTDLISIFMTYGKSNNNKEAIQKNWPRIKSVTCNNPFIISLLAKQYYLLKPDSESLNHLLTALEQPNLKHDSNKVFRFNNDTANMTGYIRKIFINLIEMSKLNKASNDNSDTNTNLIFIAACISYFGWEKIPISFLKKVIPCVDDFDKAIKFLNQTGILSSDLISVQMPILIVYSLQYYPISKDNGADISYKNIMQLTKNLNNYLEKPSPKDPYLGNILLHFAKILYDKVKVKNNPKQHSTSNDFELWQLLLQRICFYYHTYGNFRAEAEISKLFKFPTDIQNRSSKLNSNIIKLEAFLYQCKNPGTDKYVKALTDYIDSLCQLIGTELKEDMKPSFQINNSKSKDLSTKFNHKYYGFSIGLMNSVDMNISLFFFTKLCKIVPNCWFSEKVHKWIDEFNFIDLNSLNIYPAIKRLFPTNCDSDYQMRYYDFVSKIISKEGETKNDIIVQKDITYYMNESFYRKSNTEKNFLLRGIAVSLYALYFKLQTEKYNDLPRQRINECVNNQLSRFEQGIDCCHTIQYETFRICFYLKLRT